MNEKTILNEPAVRTYNEDDLVIETAFTLQTSF